MSITIRDATEDDLPAIFRIRTDPLVASRQYRLGERDTVEYWKQLLFGEVEGNRCFRCTTVVHDQEVVGHISQYHLQIVDQTHCYCGWNLAPSHWGRGVMTAALSQLFDAFFHDRRVDFVVSDCFSNNHRCIRLLANLGYRPTPFSLWLQLQFALAMKSLRWIRRFELTPDDWNRRAGSRAARLEHRTTP